MTTDTKSLYRNPVLSDDLPVPPFTSYPLVSWKNRVDAYLDALEKEIDYTAAKFYHKHLNSIYIGGGTPTTLETLSVRPSDP